jgi:hypothetical protein
MSQQNKTTLQSNINSQLADNTSGNISAANVRDNLINITDSLLFINNGPQSITGPLNISGSGNYTDGLTVTGSIISTSGFTGSLQGTSTTASYFSGTVVSASYAQTASYVAVNYTIYKALVTLSSSTFTITQLQNTIGDGSNTSPNDIVWSNPSNGIIRATKSGAFTSSNILISVENINNGGVPYICVGQKSTSNFISINIFLHDGTLLSTPNFVNLPVEIRIY